MKTFELTKTLKITIGCCLAFLIARFMELDSSSSVVTITLLSILNTRKDTFQMAKKRFLAFFTAAAVAWTAFFAFHYTVPALGIYLLIYHALCQSLRLMEGFSMSTVLMLHLWKGQNFSAHTFFNEFTLMTIGIAMAILMNLYMPGRVRQIHQAQDKIEAIIKEILKLLSESLTVNIPDPLLKERLETLRGLLEEALVYAKYTEDNNLFKDMGYYRKYITMRLDQYRVLRRICKNLPRLGAPYDQTVMTAEFIEEIALSLHEHNNAAELLDLLAALRTQFRWHPLPATRKEFESRAVLFEIVNLLEDLLMVKRRFAQSLSEDEIRRFWTSAPPR